ncbi:MAG TPA: autotransporter-associated beta strand repeat-containing protein, partial [Prosthecobacter sp.]
HSIGAISALTTGGGRDYTVYVTTAAGILTISTPLTSAVPLVKSGAGTLSLTAAGTGNAFTDVYLNHGTVLADDLDRLGTGTLRFFGGTLKLAAGWTDDLSTKTLDINTGGGTLDVAAVTAGVTLVNGLDDSTVNAADTLNIFTRATGTGTTGQLTINGSSSYTGTVVFRNSGINGGSVNGVVLNGDTNAAINGNVEIGNVTNINDTFDVVVALGASEQIVDTASITFRGASGENAYFKLMGFTETVAGISDTTREGVIENVENAEAGVTTTGKLIVDSSNDYSYNAYLRNRGSGSNANLLEFEKRGTGTQTLIGDRITYTGTTTISGGTLAIQDVTNWASAIVNDSVLNINQTTGSRTHAQAISGTGSVLKTGTGTVVLSGTNSYAGQTSIQQGVLSFSASNNLGDDAPTNSIRLENNATLQSTGANVDLGTNRSVTFGGTGGTVEVVGTGRLTAPGALVGEERHTLTKTGDGALVLSNTDNGTSFRGATQVNAGILQAGAGGFGSTGTGSVTLASGTTLAGSGLVHGTTVISTGAVLQPGDVNTVGTAATTLTSMHIMHFSASGPALTVQDGGQIRLGIGSTPTYVSTGVIDAAANGTYTNALAYITANGAEFTSNWNVIPANATDMDFINLAGGGSSLSIGNRATGTFGDGSVLVSVLGTAQNGQVFNLIDWQGLTGINGNFDTGGSLLYDGNGNVIAGDLDLGALGAGLAWDVSAFAQYGILVVVAVPEPSRALLLLCGLLGLLMRRRRRA